MKKNNNFKAILMVNVVILTLITLNSTYRPLLDKLAKQYVKLKKKNRMDDVKSSDYKIAFTKLLDEAKTNIGDIGNLVKEALMKHPIQEINNSRVMSENVQNYLYQRLESIDEPIFGMQDSILSLVDMESNILDEKEIYNIDWVNPGIKSKFFQQLCGTMSLIIVLNTLGLSNIESEFGYLDNYIIEDLENVFAGIIDYQVYNANSIEIDRIEQTFPIKQKIDLILEADSPYEEKFNRILKLEGISLDQAIAAIISSDVTNYINVFNYILSMDQLKQYEKMEYIIDSNIATYEEIFQFIMEMEELTVEEKVWYALLIPNVSFEVVFNDLLTIEGATRNQVIQTIFQLDIVSFDRLFSAIINVDGLTKEEFIDYLTSYQSSYNTISNQDLIQYILSLSIFTTSEQLDCIWAVLSNYPLNTRVKTILDFYNMTYEDFLNLYAIKNNLTEEQSIVWDIMMRVNEEKRQYILEHYNFDSQQQLDIVISGCSAEGAKSYYDLYWVANTLFNRITNSGYVKKHGTNPYDQFVAYKQFTVYESGLYLQYLYPRDSRYELKADLARQAFYDMFYAGYYGVAHNYIEFRSWSIETFSDIYKVSGGNRYGNEMKEENRIRYEELYREIDDTDYGWVKKLSL